MHPTVRRFAWLAMPLVLSACACGDRLQPTTAFPGGPGVSTTGKLSPGALPEGVTATRPAFDGDAFSAVLPTRAQKDLAPEQALKEIEPVLRAMGFQRSLADLRVPNEPVLLPAADLEPLAEETCREAVLQNDKTARQVCDSFSGADEESYAAEAVLRNAYGASLAELKSELERPVLQYSFVQIVNGVPIDGAGVFASRRSGESLSTVHGTLFNDYEVVNEPAKDPRKVLDAARKTLGNWLHEKCVPAPVPGDPVLVHLPYGSGREGTALRHAWRLVLGSERSSVLAWIDAATGEVLMVAPQWDHAQAQGERWRRDPGLPAPGNTAVVPFAVDPASGSRFVLALDDAEPRVFRRVDRFGDGYFDDGEVSVPAGTEANASFLSGDEASAVCDQGNNPGFRQVHAYSHLYSFWRTITSAGSIPRFPENPIWVWIDYEDDGQGSGAYYDWGGYNAENVLLFVDGNGFLHPNCPDSPAGTRMNGVQDVTSLAHEMAHLSVKRLQDRRPRNWCAGSGCPLPNGCGRALFHDFADAIGTAYANTPCYSGWTHKNQTATDASLYCATGASEEGGLPRLIRLPEDRFPDHHLLGTGPYADGQIAAAALWTVRQGMRSKDLAAGTILFWERLQRALWNFAFLQPTCLINRTWTASGYIKSCQTCDRDHYRYLQDLERRLLEQWVVPGVPDGHTANKVLAGWAAAGIFLVPYQCLDGNPTTWDSAVCPSGDSGGDAIIDVDDGDTTDDLEEDGVRHPEVDYLKRGTSSTPRFRIWTGPRFRFSAAGGASTSGTPLCNTQYRIEVSDDAEHFQSAGGPVTNCYADVAFPNWDTLQGMSGTTKIYYRVITWNDSNSNERISTKPGAGAFNVPLPFVIVNDTGRPPEPD